MELTFDKWVAMVGVALTIMGKKELEIFNQQLPEDMEEPLRIEREAKSEEHRKEMMREAVNQPRLKVKIMGEFNNGYPND